MSIVRVAKYLNSSYGVFTAVPMKPPILPEMKLLRSVPCGVYTV